MKIEEKLVKVYVSDTGKEFFSEDECIKYENILRKTKYFAVRYNPDLNETGNLTKVEYFVVYSSCGNHDKILLKFITDIRKIPIIGQSVMGYKFQEYFDIIQMNYTDFKKSYDNNMTTVLSSFEHPDFPGKSYYDYCDKWGFKF